MTREVTCRFKINLFEINLFGMALFWQKAIEILTKFIIHFLTYKVERLFNSEFYGLLVLQISFKLAENMDCWVTGQCAAELIGGQGLTSHVM